MKIVFTGPECSGKTTIAMELSKVLSFGFVQETARMYLNARNNQYDIESLNEISLLQSWEEKFISLQFKDIICDTDLLTIIIWAKEKFSMIDQNMFDYWLLHLPNVYFLCKPDIPWIYDQQREHPYDRDRLFDFHLTMLDNNNVEFHIIEGSLKTRLNQVLYILKNTYHLKTEDLNLSNKF